MHARGTHALQILNCAGKFAFRCTDARHLLHERRQPERTEFVEKFVAVARASGQTFFREKSSGLSSLADRNTELGAVEAGLKRDASLREHGSHAAYVGGAQGPVKRLRSRARGRK